MYPSRLYQNSKCVGAYLHDFKIIQDFTHGAKEVCQKCKKQMIFTHKTPNRVYVSYHIRETLQKSNSIFAHEYNR
jgi:hypothetical protein